MNEKISEALKNLRDVLQDDSHEHCVGVDVHFDHQGYEVTQYLRSPGSLERDGISMRNMRGEFIEKANSTRDK